MPHPVRRLAACALTPFTAQVPPRARRSADVTFSKSGTTTKLTATYAGAPPATGIWTAVGLGSMMANSAVAIGRIVNGAASFNEYKLSTYTDAFQDTKLAQTIKNPAITSANGNVVRSADRWALGPERHQTGSRRAPQVFTFEADLVIAGAAFTTADTVVAAWGTLNADGTRLMQHSGRGATTAKFTWSDGVASAPPTTEPPTTTTPTTATPTTATPTTATPTTASPTAAPTPATPTNVTNTPTSKAPTTAPPASVYNCSDTELARIAACRKSSLQTEAACKANSF